MLSLYLLTVVGLVVVAATDPHDFTRLCSSPAPGGECPAGWNNVDGDCVKFVGMDQAKAQEVCREERAEYSEFVMMVEDTDSAARHSLPVCLVRRETQCQCGRINSVTKTVFGVPIEKKEYPWEVRLSTSRDPSITCGGSIINRDEVLTSANCFGVGHSVESIIVFTSADDELLGRVDGELSHVVCSKREHPDEDLAVLTLCEPLMFSKAVGPVCLPEPVQEKHARLILARLPASILSTKICNEDRDGSPLAVMGGDGRYTQMAVGCTEPGDSWFYIKYNSLKDWIKPSTSTTAASTTITATTSTPEWVNQPQQASQALIITGGSSVEVYYPGTNTHCTLPSLPVRDNFYSQDGLVRCGGYNSRRSCHTLNTDTAQWTKTHRLHERRVDHSSWRRADGSILLIGGYNSNTTTELISDSSGVSTPGFNLKYDTVTACSITDTSSVVITGGVDSNYDKTFRVTRYDKNGWVEDLHSLLTARYRHGCALYTTDTGDKVYVVMGGFGDKLLSSTETLQLGEDAWRESTALPRPLEYMRAATLDNTIYITGGLTHSRNERDEIYLLDTKTKNWVEVARMKTPRHAHGLSVIKYSEVEGLCTEE